MNPGFPGSKHATTKVPLKSLSRIHAPLLTRNIGSSSGRHAGSRITGLWKLIARFQGSNGQGGLGSSYIEQS